MKTGDIGGKYRGQDWNHHYPRHNIRRRLERRLQIAQENGDETLVNLLKKESQDLALNY